jgi:hypothetical protein
MQTLSGTWKLAMDPKDAGRKERWFERIRPEANDAPVPGIIQQVFPEGHGVAWYWREFQPIRQARPNERYHLIFGAVDYLAEVWVNGKPIGGHEGGETPFTLDATEAVQPGKRNLLAVRVLNPTDESIDGIRLMETPHKGKNMSKLAHQGCYNYGGILAPVELSIVPAVYIADVFARPNAKTGEIRTTITVHNDTTESSKRTLSCLSGPANGGEIFSSIKTEVTFPPGRSVHELVIKIDRPHLWNLDDPFLYRVTARLEGQAPLHAHEKMVRCGFREFRVENGYFRLNGKRVFLKSTHTGNHVPIGWYVPQDPDLVRRDMLMLKTAGYNCIRFLTGMGWSEQMDFADEIGLMVYQECSGSWLMEESPEMNRRYDRATREMILRDRNHPSVTIWGMSNETVDSPLFRHAVEALSLVRELDDTRLVLLSSGRWDCHWEIGSVSNPGSKVWEHVWGQEAPNPKPGPKPAGSKILGGYYQGAGDAHVYPPVPHTPEIIQAMRNLGRDSKPVFLSEYGIGSLLDVVRGTRWFEQYKARPDYSDFSSFRQEEEKLKAGWKKWGFEGTYAFLGDFLRDSQRLHTRQRALGLDIVRSNPKFCGYNLTGILDHGITAEGVWTFFREWKPGSAEMLCEGWAPLKWCLFIDPAHNYSGRKFKLEAVLASEDVLGPGRYPCTFKVHGACGTVWEKTVTLTIPKPKPGRDNPLAFPVLCEEIRLKAPAGDYEFSAYMERGGAPFGGRLKFHITEPVTPAKPKPALTLFGVDKSIEKWLVKQGIKCSTFQNAPSKKHELILAGNSEILGYDREGWNELSRRMTQGSCVIFISPDCFQKREKNNFIGKFEKVGDFWVSDREFEVPNVPKEEWEVYAREFWGPVHFLVSGLPEGEYDVELGFCEGFLPTQGIRVFDTAINGRTVLKEFDIVKEAGGFQRAVTRKFRARTQNKKIDIAFTSVTGSPSVSRLRVYNSKGQLVAEETAHRKLADNLYWLPLKKKGKLVDYWDWLYHKECVAKAHPVFAGLPAKGIMDWDYYGPVISHKYFEGLKDPAEVIAACFATGCPTPEGYLAGLMMCRYRFGAGNFILNTFNLLENIDKHPAADRLLLNLINYTFNLTGTKND